MSGGAYPEGEPVILASARKRGIPDADIIHAYHHPLTRLLGNDDMLMNTGFNRSGTATIEVGYLIAEGTVFIIHSMSPARPQYLPQPRRRHKRR